MMKRGPVPRTASVALTANPVLPWARVSLLLAIFVAAVIIMNGRAFATSVIPITDADLYGRAKVVVHGVVVSNQIAKGGDGKPYTITTISPSEVLKGELVGNLVLHQLGGVLPNGSGFRMWGRPEFALGDEVLVFAIERSEGNYQTAEMLLGKFSIVQDEQGAVFAIPELAWTSREVNVLKSSVPSAPDSFDSLHGPRRLGEFLSYLRTGAAGTQQEGPAPKGRLIQKRSKVSLKSDETNWRGLGGLWRYKNGGSAGWMTDGTANTTSGGGPEAQRALASWTNDSTSIINYTLGGSNQIHLNAGSSPCGWSTPLPAGLGVVGCGGPDTFDTHPYTVAGVTETYTTIVGGEVWLRTYSTTNQINSTTTESILLHELGHTLGLGHSDEGTQSPYDVCPSNNGAATMRSSVQNRTSLGTDDTDAVRWLYGDGNNSCAGACTAPTISSSPSGSTIAPGGSANLSVGATGTSPFTYQWYRGTSGNTSDPVAGATSSSLNVSPATTTTYWARVTNSCGNANSNAATITVSAASLNAAFSVSPTSGVVSVTNFIFTDQSTGPLTSRQWNFGDGASSTAANPSHVYTAAGTYTVTLTIFGSGGTQSSISKSVSVSSAATPVVADFRVSASSGTAGLTGFAFTDRSTGPVTSWLWNFGDGSGSNLQNPTRVYPNPGTFVVSLTVTGNGGVQSSKQTTISVTSPSPTLNANFSFSPSSVTTETTLSFVDQSNGGPTSWNWNFGDGSSSTLQNPSKKYANPGTYTVSLTVSKGAATASTSQLLIVGAGAPITPLVIADFETAVSSAAVNQQLSFVDRSSGSPTSWLWNFGDGQTSALQNPTHAFAAPGAYTVTLTASNGGGSSVKVRNVSITQTIERFRSLIPVTTQTSGVGSTFWRTELTVYNAGDVAVNLDFIYVPGSGGPSLTRSTVIGSGGTVSYANTLPDLFGLTSGSGGLTVQGTSPIAKPNLKVSSRTFTTSSNGTYGQFVPDVDSAFPAVTYLTGIDSNAEYRTNIGIVNSTTSAVNTVLSLYDSAGALLGSTPIAVPGNNFQQMSIASIFPALSGQQRSGMSMKIQAAIDGAVSVYASTIDNRSQDPIFYPAIPLPRSQDVMVPAVARIPGAAGTFWRSDVTVFNPTGNTMTLTFRLLLENVDNRGASGKLVTLQPGRTLTIQDVITWLNAGNSKGALQIVATGASVAPIVNSRTYTSRADGGTYGQWIDATEVSNFGRESVVTGLRSDGFYRTNFGFVNSGDQPIGVTVVLYNGFSQQLGAVFLTLLPKSQVQPSLANLFPGVNPQSVGGVTMRAFTNDAATLFAYGSMIDNNSGDPIFVRGK